MEQQVRREWVKRRDSWSSEKLILNVLGLDPSELLLYHLSTQASFTLAFLCTHSLSAQNSTSFTQVFIGVLISLIQSLINQSDHKEKVSSVVESLNTHKGSHLCESYPSFLPSKGTFDILQALLAIRGFSHVCYSIPNKVMQHRGPFGVMGLEAVKGIKCPHHQLPCLPSSINQCSTLLLWTHTYLPLHPSE